ncbi:MAG: hypothetical protein ACREUV_06410 [Burkholderiales bacterium]
MVVECKRPQNYASIKPRMRDALNQIDKRVVESQTDTVGIAALDITKTSNPVHNQRNFPKQIDFDQKLDRICRDCFERLKHEWKLDKHQNTVGVLMRVCGLGISHEIRRYTYYNEFVFFGFTGENKRHNEVLKALEKAFLSTSFV